MSTFLGVDPGLHGAIATFGPHGVEAYDMPAFELKGKTKPDIALLDSVLRGIVAVREPRLAVVENVHSMPKQGVASSFTFGYVTGIVHALLATHKIPVHLVSPGAWKRLMGLSSDKDASRARASQLFPAASHLWTRKKDDGRAEAALLAYYGSRLQ